MEATCGGVEALRWRICGQILPLPPSYWLLQVPATQSPGSNFYEHMRCQSRLLPIRGISIGLDPHPLLQPLLFSPLSNLGSQPILGPPLRSPPPGAAPDQLHDPPPLSPLAPLGRFIQIRKSQSALAKPTMQNLLPFRPADASTETWQTTLPWHSRPPFSTLEQDPTLKIQPISTQPPLHRTALGGHIMPASR